MHRVLVDRFGRILIPKQTRDQLGLFEGARLRLEVSGETILLRPDLPDGMLVRERGVLVWSSRPLDADVNDVIDQVREDRTKKIRGS